MTVVVPIGSAKPEPAAQPERVGVLLVNLGTPDTADARGVRVYLKDGLDAAAQGQLGAVPQFAVALGVEGRGCD